MTSKHAIGSLNAINGPHGLAVATWVIVCTFITNQPLQHVCYTINVAVQSAVQWLNKDQSNSPKGGIDYSSFVFSRCQQRTDDLTAVCNCMFYCFASAPTGLVRALSFVCVCMYT